RLDEVHGAGDGLGRAQEVDAHEAQDIRGAMLRPRPHPSMVARRPSALGRSLMFRTCLPSLAALACLTLAPPAPAAPRSKAASSDEPHLPVTTFKLRNGLTVLVSEDHNVPVVTVDVWYHVGSKDEAPGRTGFAHLFEHMMFKGSAHVGDGEHFRLVTE